MRIIPGLTGALILMVYWLVTLSSRRILAGWTNSWLPRYRRLFVLFYYAEAMGLTLCFCFLYFIKPTQSGSHYYFFHSLFNAILIADLFSKMPLAIAFLASLFAKTARTGKVLAHMGLIISSGIFIVITFGIIQGTRAWSVQEYTLTFRDLPPSFDGLRIAQLSDTHLGSYRKTKLLSRFSSVIHNFDPHLVFFTGDLVNNYGNETTAYSGEFRQLKSSRGNFAVLGNHDYGDYTMWPDSISKVNNLNHIKQFFREAGFRLLRNESEKLVRESDSLYIVGIENPGHSPGKNYADTEMAVSQLPDSCFCILLCHDPGFWDTDGNSDRRFALTLSGHTHGMQWGIHVAGIRLSPAKLIRERWGGLYKKEDRYLYVNRGAGVVGMFFRIDMPAEITLLTLKRVKID